MNFTFTCSLGKAKLKTLLLRNFGRKNKQLYSAVLFISQDNYDGLPSFQMTTWFLLLLYHRDQQYPFHGLTSCYFLGCALVGGREGGDILVSDLLVLISRTLLLLLFLLYNYIILAYSMLERILLQSLLQPFSALHELSSYHVYHACINQLFVIHLASIHYKIVVDFDH